MTDLALALAFISVIGVAPTLAGVLPLTLARKQITHQNVWIFAGLAVGILLALFNDLLGEASGLGQALGFARTLTQPILVASFMFGPILLVYLSGFRWSSRPGLTYAWSGFLVALGIAFHSIGEGVVVGYDFRASELALNLGTVLQALSFALHKFAEGFVISIMYFRGRKLRYPFAAAAIGSVPGLLGVVAGYVPVSGLTGSAFFAMGAGATIFILAQQMPLALGGGGRRVSVPILAGFLIIYLAGLIHSAVAP